MSASCSNQTRGLAASISSFLLEVAAYLHHILIDTHWLQRPSDAVMAPRRISSPNRLVLAVACKRAIVLNVSGVVELLLEPLVPQLMCREGEM